MGGGWNEATCKLVLLVVVVDGLNLWIFFLKVIKLLTRLGPFEMDALSDYFAAQMGKTLDGYLPEKTKLNGWVL